MQLAYVQPSTDIWPRRTEPKNATSPVPFNFVQVFPSRIFKCIPFLKQIIARNILF